MTSRERVLAAISHKEPDVFPLDFGGHRSSGINAIAYKNLREYLGLEKKPIRIYDIVQQLAYIDEDVLDLFHVDTREIGRAFSEDLNDWKEWDLHGVPVLVPKFINLQKEGDVWYILSEKGEKLGFQKPDMFYFSQYIWPLKSQTEGITAEKIRAALSNQMWATPSYPDLSKIPTDVLIKKTKKYYAENDKAITYLFGGSFWEPAGYIFGLEDMFMNLALEPDMVNLAFSTMLKLHNNTIDSVYKPIADSVDIVVLGDDLGMQNGLLFSHDMYKQLVKPYQKVLWKRLKEVGKAKLNLHSCGSVEALMDDFVDIGLDTINPVQISAKDMDAENLKKKHSSTLCMWGGGCDTQSVLPFATPEEVKKHVIHQVETFGKKDFVFQQVHNIVASVPPENIVAMFDQVNEIRGFSTTGM